MHRKLALPVVGALALLSAGAYFALSSARGPEVGSPKLPESPQPLQSPQAPQATRTATFALG